VAFFGGSANCTANAWPSLSSSSPLLRHPDRRNAFSAKAKQDAGPQESFQPMPELQANSPSVPSVFRPQGVSDRAQYLPNRRSISAMSLDLLLKRAVERIK
jgi:hypothetical protein